ncbi:MAG: hypothetical protein AAGK26_17675, partial [Pseudomonadota bacterium]
MLPTLALIGAQPNPAKDVSRDIAKPKTGSEDLIVGAISLPKPHFSLTITGHPAAAHHLEHWTRESMVFGSVRRVCISRV